MFGRELKLGFYIPTSHNILCVLVVIKIKILLQSTELPFCYTLLSQAPGLDLAISSLFHVAKPVNCGIKK